LQRHPLARPRVQSIATSGNRLIKSHRRVRWISSRTSTPSGRAMFQMMGVFVEFERAMIRERVLAGTARARSEGRALGRKRREETDAAKVAAIRTARAKGLWLAASPLTFTLGSGP